MKNLLSIEIAVLVLLVVVAIFVRVGYNDPQDPAGDTLQSDGTTNTTQQTEPSEQTQQTQPPEPTETTEVFAPETTAPTVPHDKQPDWMMFPEDRELKAQQYFVYDCDTDEFLVISGEPDDQVEPASITKLFTAYVAMQYLEPTDKIKATNALELVVAGSSIAMIDWANVLTAEMLIEAMLLPSGNDAAYVLAVAVGREIDGKPKESASTAAKTFVAEMNRQAQALGMTGTNFVNPDGIHRDRHYSTLKDLALLGKLSMENETIMKYAAISKDNVTFASGQTKEWENTNALINEESEYYCPYAVGLKTGQTPYAGSCLLSAFQYEGRNLVIGVFGCPKTDDRFEDTLQLFNETMGFAYLEEDSSLVVGE